MKIEPKKTLGVGLLSIVVTFVVLTLTVLGSLSVMSARADYKLSQKNGEYVKAYYEAEKRAEEMLAMICEQTKEAQGYELAVDYKIEESKNYINVTYQVPIVDEQVLQVIVGIDKTQDVGYQILSWQTVNQREWQGDALGFEDTIVIEGEEGSGG